MAKYFVKRIKVTRNSIDWKAVVSLTSDENRVIEITRIGSAFEFAKLLGITFKPGGGIDDSNAIGRECIVIVRKGQFDISKVVIPDDLPQPAETTEPTVELPQPAEPSEPTEPAVDSEIPTPG